MQSSAQRILGARRIETAKLVVLVMPISAIGALTLASMWSLIQGPDRPKWIGTTGLVLDLIGAVLVALPLFITYQDPVKEGMQSLSHYEPYRTMSIVQHQERLTLPMQVGAVIFILGFAFQIVAQWA